MSANLGGYWSLERHVAHFDQLAATDGDHFQWLRQGAFEYQKQHNLHYSRFNVSEYLPVEAFKLADICCFDPDKAERVFMSSATGGSTRSRHLVKSLDIYNRAIRTGFEHAFGQAPFILIGHLPAYHRDSSLVYMVEYLCAISGHPASGLFLDDSSVLKRGIELSEKEGIRLFVFGAAFGLLDLLERSIQLTLPDDAIVIETGGMKTHRKEMDRLELHSLLSHGFGVPLNQVRSEYGMCELLSQCYTGSEGLFCTPPWVSVSLVDPDNPNEEVPDGTPGLLAITDLANIHTVCTLLTQDLGVRRKHGFEIIGRQTSADLRGCNFLFEDPQSFSG